MKKRFVLSSLLAAAALAAGPAGTAAADVPEPVATSATTAVRAQTSTSGIGEESILPMLQSPTALDASGGDPRVTAYWSSERLENAIPLTTPTIDEEVQNDIRQIEEEESAGQPTVLSDPTPASDLSSQLELAPLNVTNWSQTNGKDFFHNTVDGKDYACSGAAANSGSKRLVVTAGHCVYQNGAWHTNWVFVPGYNNGAEPHGMFSAYRMRTFTDWMTYGSQPLGWNSDVAFVTTNTNSSGSVVVNAVGGHGVSYNYPSSVSVDIFGYPQNLSNGEVMYACSGTAVDRLLLIYHLETISGCNFGGGASGGPWLRIYNNSNGLGYVDSVSSNGPADNSYLNGPYFDTRMSSLYTNANNDW